jgi:hypothetical protein
MMQDYKKDAVRVERWEKMAPEERGSRFPIGVLVDQERVTFMEAYREVCERASGKQPVSGK